MIFDPFSNLNYAPDDDDFDQDAYDNFIDDKIDSDKEN